MTIISQTHSMHEAFMAQYPEEAARVFETYPVAEVLDVLKDSSGRDSAKILSAMTPSIAADILRAMSIEMFKDTISQIDPSLSATLLRRFPGEKQYSVLKELPQSVATEIKAFLEYPEDSVGTLMDPQFFSLPQDLHVEEAIIQIRTHAPRDLHEIYVIDRSQILTGILPLRDLFLAPVQEPLQSIMKRELPTIHPLESQEQMVEVFEQWKVFTIPVTDLNGRLLGIIRNRDIIEAEKEEATIGMQTMVGASKDERALSPPMFAVRKRLPWLQINLLTAFLAAFVVGLFEDTIAPVYGLGRLASRRSRTIWQYGGSSLSRGYAWISSTRYSSRAVGPSGHKKNHM